MISREINTKALLSNVQSIKKLAGKNIDILAVVKADAYGHGLEKVAKVLNRGNIKFFGVSDINEAITLREIGIKKRIMLLEHALPEQAKYLIKYNITPVVCSVDLAKALNQLLIQRKIKFPVHIKIDTGMSRLGVYQANAFDFVAQIQTFSGIKVEGICTHFPLADTNRFFTEKQIKSILQVTEQIKKEISTIKYVHAANSMGFVAFSNKGFNLVRTGLMLYGLYPSTKIKNKIKLTPVMSVKSRICFIKSIPKGRGVSYGHTFIAKKKMRIATISIGYHDGYFRAFSNRAKVIVRGKLCPVVGNVTMDQIMVDVSAVKNISVGDKVCIMGTEGKSKISAEDLAKIASTINYEIVCVLGNKL